MAASLRKLLGRLKRKFMPADPPPVSNGNTVPWVGGTVEAFWSEINGIFHVGASTGQEVEDYENLGLNVVWFEAIPEVFETLERTVAPYPKQIAIQALLSDTSGETAIFNVASNNGESSSMFAPAKHRSAFPNVSFDKTISLETSTLAAAIESNEIDMDHYDALTIGTQGAELLVLKGAGKYLREFRFVKAEATDFELYEGACTFEELNDFMQSKGFREVERTVFYNRPDLGNCFDVTYERQDEPKG